MKIICFIDDLCPGGAQRQLINLSISLKRFGHAVRIATYHNNTFYLDELKRSEIAYDYVHEAESTLTRIYYMRRYFKKNTPDIVIAYLETPAIIACLSKMTGVKFKLIVSERNTSQKNGIFEAIRFSFFSIADTIVPNSYSQENFILSHYPNLKDKVFTITNCVDLDTFKPCEPIKNAPLKILSVGRITPQKNIIMYIQAVRKVVDRFPQVSFVWYGDTDMPDYDKQCRDEILRLGLSKNFIFKPAAKRIIPIYQSATVFCLPSIYEGFPNVICEAMSCGKPILCGNVCDNPRLVRDGINGYLFDPLRTDSMAETIVKFLTMSSSDIYEMGRMGRVLAEEDLSEEKMINKYLSIIAK